MDSCDRKACYWPSCSSSTEALNSRVVGVAITGLSVSNAIIVMLVRQCMLNNSRLFWGELLPVVDAEREFSHFVCGRDEVQRCSFYFSLR
jgi:hypothetical protein